MKRWGVALSTGCAIALVAALVPAVASGVSVEAPGTGNFSVDERKKPKPSKSPKPSKTPKPTKSPQPTASPTPTAGAPVPAQARAIEEWIKAQPKTYEQAESTFVYTTEPSLVGSVWEKTTLLAAKPTFEVHALLGQPVTRPLRMYLGWSGDWLKANVPRDACPYISDFSQASACPRSNVIYTRLSNFQAYSPGLTPTSDPGAMLRFGYTGLPGHEVTHLVQESLYPQRTTRTYPTESQWLVEGWAVMTQTMIAMRTYNLTYAQARDRSLKVNGSQCAGVKLRDLLAPPTFNSCVYPNGFLAMEYLMWKTGDMKAGWTWVSQDAVTGREAFTKAFSMDIDTFMTEADAYVNQEISLWAKREYPR